VIGVPLGELVAESLPHPAEQTAPFWLSVHATPLFAESFCTVAVNCCVTLTLKRTDVGETETETPGVVTVSVAKADLDGSATEVAVRVTAAFVGTAAGAV